MPIILHSQGKAPRVSHLKERITKMTMRELIEYEAALWCWVGKMPMENIAGQLNAIYREVEWRSQDKDFR
jgi:hypothetical protein